MVVCTSGSESSGSTSKAWIFHSLLIGAAVTAAAASTVSHRSFFRRILRRGGYQSQVIGIIPARFASSRFPGKPLVQILEKPMIQHSSRGTTLQLTPNLKPATGSPITPSPSHIHPLEYCQRGSMPPPAAGIIF
ncbi:hypothetical protein KSP40_PGU006912 [Platanthera guangdongensis]|uniref:Uncharacterized protein n=1 Tax=Platanthera guangdongensis TaxID=2320717 RepID=A0ABR2MIC8_9ASPA